MLFTTKGERVGKTIAAFVELDSFADFCIDLLGMAKCLVTVSALILMHCAHF